jgi:CheY-like chemotaxis protein
VCYPQRAASVCKPQKCDIWATLHGALGTARPTRKRLGNTPACLLITFHTSRFIYVFPRSRLCVLPRIPGPPLFGYTLGPVTVKILIADDDARIRQMLKQIVASLASEVYEATDGGDAIALCAAQRPDWVLMDFRMKPMDGLRATAHIKVRLPQTRIVIVSQYDEAELRAEAARAGACAYVLKENLHDLPAILAGTTLGALAESSTTALNQNRTPIPSNH